MSLKSFIRRAIPAPFLALYHRALALGADVRYGHPSRSMIVVGVTGTKGKTSTANFIWSVLTAGGCRVGLISTANIRIGEAEQMNFFHMTMPGRFHLQKLLADMRRAGCTHVVVETTSEGIKQSRHVGIAYDIVVFTNLSPEHLASHGGSFEVYKEIKGELFASLARGKRKVLNGETVPKVIIANADDPRAEYFLHFSADQKQTFGLTDGAGVWGLDVRDEPSGVSFRVGKKTHAIHIPGRFNVPNALAAIAVGRALGISDEKIARGIGEMRLIPGRMEEIIEGLSAGLSTEAQRAKVEVSAKAGQPFRVFVDYAHEKVSMTAALEAARVLCGSFGRVIVLLGAEGGGRDKSKRPELGEIAARLADIVIVSNVDPYEDDPEAIAEDIARASETHGKKRGENLFVILDRREGITKALALAQQGDVVLITGKGAEQSIIIGGKSAPWDDRSVVRKELHLIKK